MAAGDTTLGRRQPDTDGNILPEEDPKAGDYWIIRNPVHHQPGPENLTGIVLGIFPPRVGGIAVLSMHTVREEEDGTISIRPGDGSSNSILVTNQHGTWHGYIEHGLWKEI